MEIDKDSRALVYGSKFMKVCYILIVNCEMCQVFFLNRTNFLFSIWWRCFKELIKCLKGLYLLGNAREKR